MPAAISHYLLAKRVMEKQGALLSLQEDAFLWGAQGPDFLFCHRFFPWQRGESLREIGVRLHRDSPSRTLEWMRSYLKRYCGDLTARSYVLGFLSHYTFDSIAHPFIQYGAYRMNQVIESTSEETCHNVIESALDTILLRYERGELPSSLPLKRIVPKSERAQAAMVRLYAKLLETFYHKKGAEGLLRQAIRDCRLTFGIMTDRTTLKKQFMDRRERGKEPVLSSHLRPMSEGDEFDFANIQEAEWQWPPESDEVHTESFFALFEEAVSRTIQWIDGFLNGVPLLELTGDKSF